MQQSNGDFSVGNHFDVVDMESGVMIDTLRKVADGRAGMTLASRFSAGELY